MGLHARAMDSSPHAVSTATFTAISCSAQSSDAQPLGNWEMGGMGGWREGGGCLLRDCMQTLLTAVRTFLWLLHLLSCKTII